MGKRHKIIYRQKVGKGKGKLAFIVEEGKDLLVENPRSGLRYGISKYDFNTHYEEVKHG